MKTLYIIKPQKLDLKFLTEKFKPNFDLNVDSAYLIIHLIIVLGSEKNNRKVVRLHSKMLEKLIGRNYHKYFDYLLENYPATGSVLKGFRYSKNKPFGYTLTNYYYDGGFELHEINSMKIINKFNQEFVKNIKNEQIRTNYYFLMKYFNKDKLSVYKPNQALLEANQLPEHKRLKNMKNILDILNGKYSVKLKPTTDGRVHSNITRLSKHFRKYLQYEDEFLAEIDISSSVLFSLFIIMNLYIDNNLTYLTQFTYNSNPYIYMFDKVTGDIDKSELHNFGELILNGIIYEEFSRLILSPKIYEDVGQDYQKAEKYYLYEFKKLFGHNFDGCTEELKKFSKKRLLGMLFAPTNTYKFEQVVFKTLFPSILKFINEYKNTLQYKDCEKFNWDKRNCHKKLSHLCFQFEAKVMIDKIAREFNKLHKGKVPIYTLHDCLLITSSYAEELKTYMVSFMLKLFGIAPNLTLEYSKFDTSYRMVS